VRPGGADRRRARRHGGLARHGEVGRAHLVLELGTLQGAGPGTPLVEHDDALPGAHLGEPREDPGRGGGATLTRPAGEEHHRPVRPGVTADDDRQVDRSATGC
jgi:hypothetical protein